jgi:hypothetical protein
MAASAAPLAPAAQARRPPPVTEVAVATMMLVVTGGIYLAAHLPGHAPLGVPIGLLIAAGVLLAVNAFLLSRLHDFAWATFRVVAGWTLLAYLVIAGMLEYVFVFDHTPGGTLVVLTFMLAIFAVDVPLLLGYNVARYQPSRDAAAGY